MALNDWLKMKPVVPDPGAEATSFDGSNDYLSRSSDLTGNTDSKTFTFSCLVYVGNSAATAYLYNSTGGKVVFSFTTSQLDINLKNTVGTTICLLRSTNISTGKIYGTWVNLLVSVDLAASTSHVYINDNNLTLTTETLTNDNIDFTQSDHWIAGLQGITSNKGRLSYLFLDYTYRDLSIESNRRLFITADLKPSMDQKSLNPIIGMSMTDYTTAHINDFGTGGDFIQNGVLDQAQRGPNQNNCVASEFDSTDSLSRSASYSSKVFTFSFNCMAVGASPIIFSTTSNHSFIQYRNADNKIRVYLANSSNTTILQLDIVSDTSLDRNTFISISIDMDAQVNCRAFVNGVDRSGYMSFSLFSTGQTIALDTELYIRNDTSSAVIGEFYLDDSYTDLSTNNPFWDSENNLPKPVRQVLEETGSTPLIAMPISADNPGENLGTSGDFTLNGGGLTGARGGSEFWSRSAAFDGSTGYLTTQTLTNLADSDTVTIAFAIKQTFVANKHYLNFSFNNGGFPDSSLIFFDEDFTLLNASGVTRYTLTSLGLNNTDWNILLFSVNVGTSTQNAYLNGASKTGSFLNSGTIPFGSTTDIGIGALVTTNSGSGGTVANYVNGDIGFVYFTTDYIDFSQETNRNLFVDQLGYPKDLSKQIENELIPEPLIYMPFDDPDNLGNNLYGSNFTVNGTVTPGSDVDPNA